MKKLIIVTLFICLITPLQAQKYFRAPEWRIPLLFEWPRKGYFTMLSWEEDKYDKTNLMHLSASCVIAGIGDNILEALGSENSTYYASLITFTLGFFKEVEDGYREGFSRRDLIYDAVGVGAWILVKWISDKCKIKVTANNNMLQLSYVF